MTPATSEIVAMLTEAARLGIELQAHGDKLRYRPRDRMTLALADRLRAHKTDVLAILRAGTEPTYADRWPL